ncbi:hypothetical protein CC78DRAFT_579908 [Lojkania enalia]|uniref:Uncharacterized protein n=1 Tax=Lojkania enalia TaxID=147567 RepID=A0A9P4KEG4_9PLEO|nr:hypothetical protein CC78DRAFT_579908 [Didymosphaeria enalia]
MVLLGGLEIVVGGYLVHRHYKNKNEKRRLQEEALQFRSSTFPSATSLPYPQQQGQIPHQKHAYYALPPQPQFQCQSRPHNIQHVPQTQPCLQQTQSQPYFEPQTHPLRRQQSFSSLSSIPVANGSQPQDVLPPLPPRPEPSSLSPMQQYAPVNYPYYNTGFSVSDPGFEPISDSPIEETHLREGVYMTDDRWEAYGPSSPNDHFELPGSSQRGEREEGDDPPPPYRP